MNIRNYASQFCLFTFSQNVDLGARIKFALTQAQYDNFFFTDLDELKTRVEIEPPHFVILDVESLLEPVSRVLLSLKEFSAEIKVILLCSNDNYSQLIKFKSEQVAHIFSFETAFIENYLTDAIDLLAECLFRTYQNEQVFEELKSTQEQRDHLQQTLNQEREAPQVRPYQLRIAEYKSATSKENLLDLFYQQTPQQSWIYLKFVPSIKTFLCVSYSQVPTDWVEGFSYKVSQSVEQFSTDLLTGVLPESFSFYLKNKFSTDKFKFLPVVVKEKLEGLLLSTQDISAEVAEDFSIMSLVYALFVLEAEPKQLDVEDQLTGFYNKLFYSKMLDREIDRSKRSYSALSLIKISVDKLNEIEISQGQEVANHIIKKVAQLIKATSRIPDYLCRTDVNEFTLVLTNCNRKGAAIRAERLRQVMNEEKLIFGGVPLTVSQGISEYPTLTADAFELDETALRALRFISQRGGDKICIYKPTAIHKPDFTVES